MALRSARSRLAAANGSANSSARLLFETYHVSPAYEYRGKRPGETTRAYGLRLAEELESKIDQLGGDNVIAFVAETVVGATLGAAPAVPGYFRLVREICDHHGILLILDEVMCGMGRTSSSRPLSVSVSGKRDFAGQRQRRQKGPKHLTAREQRQNAHTKNPPVRPNLQDTRKSLFVWDCVVARDLNFQPNDYQPLARA